MTYLQPMTEDSRSQPSNEHACSCDWATGECQRPPGCQAVASLKARIEELERALRPFVEYADAKCGSDKASDLRAVVCKIMENAPYPADIDAINQFCTAVLNARAALNGEAGK